MRDLRELDRWRRRDAAVLRHYGSVGDETCGAFTVPVGSHTFDCVASSDGGWDHVSISLPNRCPSWLEMDALKRLFFRDHETAMQLHLPPGDHISLHPYCLHIWRPQDVPLPVPPKEFVA